MGALMIKELAKELKGVLTIIYNRSLSESKIPNDWKMANVTPIFKKVKQCDAGNYRPISLTSHVCKILESIINPLDAGRRYTDFAQTSKRRQKPVYRVCANFPTSPETGIPGLRKLSNGARPRHTGFIF